MPGSSRLPISLRYPGSLQPARGQLLPVSLPLDVLRNILLLWFLLRVSRTTFYQLKGRGIFGSAVDFCTWARRTATYYFLQLPGIREKVDAQVAEGIGKIEKGLLPSDPTLERFAKLPAEGWSHDKIIEQLGKLAGMKHTRWEDGRVSGAVYHGGKELGKLQTEAFEMFTVSNPIHPDVFPGVRKMEAEVVAMVLSLFNAPADAGGVCTSGGTESILMACLAARNKAYKERGVTAPEMILPQTAHAAFLKAGEYFKIKIHLVACPAPSYKVDVRAVARLINPNTCLLVGSAPNFPHGIIDDISALSRLALRKKLPLHVDCCLGSFVIASLEKAGFASEPFDFRLKGVTSISCDTHKYGFAPKGSSTVLYRSRDLRAYQYFISATWPGGVYGSPSAAGSRPGALIAGCWASMMSVGAAGYVDATHRIVGAAKKIEQALRHHPELAADVEVVGKPLVSVVAFKSARPTFDVHELADVMNEKGWHLNALQSPPAIHIAVTMPIVAAADDLLKDLKSALGEMREQEIRDRKEGREKKMGNTVALYGVAGALPDKTVVKELCRGYLDTLYKA